MHIAHLDTMTLARFGYWYYYSEVNIFLTKQQYKAARVNFNRKL